MAKTPVTAVAAKAPYHHGHLREALLQQTVKLIKKRGDLDFSLRDLALQVGVSHAAVYRHFRNKIELLAAVATHGFELLTKSVEAAGAGWDHDPLHQLARQGSAYLEMAQRRPAHFTAMFAPEIQRSDQSAQVQQAADRAFALLLASVERHLGMAARGAVSPTAVHARALHCWALIHGLATLHLSGNLAACLGPRYAMNSAASREAMVLELLTA